MDKLVILLTTTTKVTITITSDESIAILATLLTAINKLTPTSKEGLVIITTTRLTTTPTRNFILTPDDDYGKIIIGDLVKIRINRPTMIPINTHTTTLNIIETNIVFATLTNFKVMYLTIMELDHASKVYAWF